MNVLAIGAHPDDIEFGCGGTLIKYAQQGHKIYLLVLTGGESGGDASKRQIEQEKAAKIIGARKLLWGKCRDTEVQINQGLIQKIENIVKKIKPSIIFVHYFDDTHQDHRHLSNCSITATRYIKNVLFYEGPTTQNFNPAVFVDIDKQVKRKLKALNAHNSQVAKTNIEGLSITDIARSSAHSGESITAMS